LFNESWLSALLPLPPILFQLSNPLSYLQIASPLHPHPECPHHFHLCSVNLLEAPAEDPIKYSLAKGALYLLGILVLLGLVLQFFLVSNAVLLEFKLQLHFDLLFFFKHGFLLFLVLSYTFFFLKFGKDFKLFIIKLIFFSFFIIPHSCLAVVLDIKIVCIESFPLWIDHKRFLLFVFFFTFIYRLKQWFLCHEEHRLLFL
jgi:hypothetical protein